MMDAVIVALVAALVYVILLVATGSGALALVGGLVVLVAGLARSRL